MPKNTTGCRIKSSIPTENMNVEKLRATKCNSSIFSQVSLKMNSKKRIFALRATADTNVFFFKMIFANF